MRNLAVIPARSGSKGLVDKNIRMLGDKPLIAHTIQAARDSEMFSEVVVSTDSERYAEVARQCGASVPFLRSEVLSTATASSWDVVRDTIGQLAARGIQYDSVALLQPTSPLRSAADIVKGYRELVAREAEAIVAVCEEDHSPLWGNTLPPDCSLKGFIDPEIAAMPRQSLPTYYRINGALYILRVPLLMARGDLFGERSYAIVMPRERSIDIDSETDFMIAEMLFNRKGRCQPN